MFLESVFFCKAGLLWVVEKNFFPLVEPEKLFPTSLCGVFVFGCALPPLRSRLPSPARRLSSPHNLSPHNLLTHTLLTHTTCHHTTCHHTTCAHTQLAHTHTTCHHTTCSHTHTHLAHTQLVTTQLVTTQLAHTQLAHTHTQLVTTQLAQTHTHTPCSHTTCHHTTCHHTTCHHTTCHHTTCAHTTCTHTHTTCHHTTCSHTQLAHTHTHTLLTHTHTHTPCSHTTCHHTTCHHTTCSHTTCSHTTCSHTTCSHTHNLLTHNLSPHNLLMAGVALMALGWLWWRAWFPFGAVDAAAVCVAGVALGDIDRYFAWQAWRLASSIVTLRGRRGTYGTGLALVARLVPVWRRGRRRCLRGRRGAWRRRPWLCVAGVALGDIDRHFAWQAWRLWDWAGSGGALGSRLAPWTPPLFAWQASHLVTLTVTLRGRRGAWRHDRHFAWQAWHLWHWAGSVGALGSRLAPWTLPLFAWQAWRLATSTVTLRGRRGAWWHRSSLCVAGVALMGLGWLWWRAWFPFGAVDAAAVCVAGVALGDIDRHFAWQAWRLATWTCILRGRRGTYGIGLVLLARLVPSWHRCGRRGSSRGRCGTWRRGRAFYVAGMALGDTQLHFARQTWHSRHRTHSFATHNFVTYTHTQLCHTQLFCTQLFHTHLSLTHTHNFVTHNFVTHTHTIFHTHLSHMQLLSHTHLCHTHNFVTHTQLCHTQLFHTQLCHTQTIFHTQLCHKQLCHTQLFHTQLCHRQPFTHNSFTHNLSRTALSLTTFHTQLFHTQLSHTQLFACNFWNDWPSAISFVFSSFSAPLQPLFLIIGRAWLVGVIRSLIFLSQLQP